MIGRSLVRSVAKEYAGKKGIPFEDLLQEGAIEAARAAKKFDEKRGRPDAYTRMCVRSRLQKVVEREWERLTPEMGSELEALHYRQDLDESLSERYDLEDAEKALSASEKRLWDMYKALEAKRGAIASIAAFEGKTRAWASDKLISIRAKLKRACERQLVRN